MQKQNTIHELHQKHDVVVRPQRAKLSVFKHEVKNKILNQMQCLRFKTGNDRSLIFMLE